MSKILIIDDDQLICQALAKKFKRMGHETDCTFTLKQGLDFSFSNEFDIVFLDVNLPDGNGLDAIDAIKDHPYAPEIIIMTGDSDPDGVELAMKSRAWDYILKSSSQKEFEFSLTRALEYRQQKQSRPNGKSLKRDFIVGESRQIKICLEKVAKASNNDTPILVTGETGVGKELFAKAIHENSKRRASSFIVVDCAALPEHIVERILFGHSKGAFTGADSDKVGLIKLADGGTLFLDEVGELPLSIQKKFLRVLQEKRIRSVGSRNEISSDFRLVSATHRDVSKMIGKGRFREDFYFRIASIKIEIPLLRNRKSDIPLLVNYHMDRKKEIRNEFPHELSREFLTQLHGYDWPGNVRELFNTIDFACSDAYNGSILFQKHLPDYIRTFNIKNKIKKFSKIRPKPDSGELKKGILPLKDHIENTKFEYIQNLLSATNNDIKESCRLSGLSRGHLYRLLQQYKLT
ncbi:MAG: sigma-54 dependent transcriptional regulator [Desulfobacula sp.]|nr:sigma-54 dependent transcriptional regulator [Desulfobacula sp.]